MAGLLIRCDATPEIGMGHITRCLVLAKELRTRGTEVRFALSRGGKLGQVAVTEAKFPVALTRAEALAGQLTIADKEDTIAAAKAAAIALVLVDHYSASSEYFTGIRDAGLEVAAIDDLADRDLSCVKLVLNQNLGAGEMPYGASPDQIRLLGPQYALLRPQFAAARNAVRKESSGRNVLLSLGGGMVAKNTRRILAELCRVPIPMEIRIAGNNGRELGGFDEGIHQVEPLGRVSDMASLMRWADLSINAGGSTCWELCCLGVPMVVYVLADNQSANAKALEATGCAVNMGRLKRRTESVGPIVRALLEDPGRRQRMAATARRLVDGRGAGRVVDALLPLLP